MAVPTIPSKPPVLAGDKRYAWKTLIMPREDRGFFTSGAESAIRSQASEGWIFHSIAPSPVNPEKVALTFYKAK